jgi:DNA-binding MarR family transcriptional regulator
MPAESPLPQDCNCLAVRQAARHVTQFYDHVLAPSGVRATQFAILAKIKWRGSMTINALAAELVMDRTTLGRNILPLERDGLIAIRQSDDDRRNKEMHLTEAGSERLRRALKLWTAAQTRFDGAFGAKQATALRTLLRAVVATELGPTAAAEPD